MPQANAAPQQRTAPAARAATFAEVVARWRAKKAEEAAEEAAEAKRRDEERKAKELVRREEERAEAWRQKEAAKRIRQEEQRRADERRKAEEEAAREKTKANAKYAKAMKAAAEARAAELERQRAREGRRVVLRHVPLRTRQWDFAQGMHPLKPGQILDMGVAEGTAWVEFWTAEEAQAFCRVVTETQHLIILNKVIKSASIYQGQVKPPEGQGYISRSLYIKAPPEFLDGAAELYPVVKKKLAVKGFTTLCVGHTSKPGTRVVIDYASLALAQSAKATLEKHYPELEVSYGWDHCEKASFSSLVQASAEGGTESSKKGSDSWFGPVELITMLVFTVVAVVADIKDKDKSSDKEAQQGGDE